MTGFTVDPDALRAQAGQVDGIASMVQDAASAADSVGYGGLNYGVIASPYIVTVLEIALGNSVGMISDAASFASDMALGLHHNADVYEQVESDINSQLGS